jgi:hypothetical protein
MSILSIRAIAPPRTVGRTLHGGCKCPLGTVPGSVAYCWNRTPNHGGRRSGWYPQAPHCRDDVHSWQAYNTSSFIGPVLSTKKISRIRMGKTHGSIFPFPSPRRTEQKSFCRARLSLCLLLNNTLLVELSAPSGGSGRT